MAPLVWPTLLIQPQPALLSGLSGHSFCPSCLDQLSLNEPSPQGSQPIPWRALAVMTWRRLILDLRRQPANLIRALASECLALLPKPNAGVVLCRPAAPGAGQALPVARKRDLPPKRPGPQALLHHRRACIGQHHLNGSQRRQNLSGVFAAEPPHHPSTEVMLLDDVTSGATSQAAAEALEPLGMGLLESFAWPSAQALAMPLSRPTPRAAGIAQVRRRLKIAVSPSSIWVLASPITSSARSSGRWQSTASHRRS